MWILPPTPLHLEVLACFIMPNQLFCLFSHLKGEEYYSFFVSLSFDKFLVLEIAFKIWSKSSKLFVLVLLWVLTGKRGGFPGGTEVKSTPANTGDKKSWSSIPESGRCPEATNGYPLQYSCLENSIDRGDWCATVHGVAKSDMTEQAQT